MGEIDPEIEEIRDKAGIVVTEKLDDNEKLKQILEMDEDDDEEREFSKGIVVGFFEQAASTYKKMKEVLQEAAQQPEKLKELSNLANFVKGSAATIGFEHVEHHCKRIEYAGNLRDPDAVVDRESDRGGISASKAQELIAYDMHKLRRRILGVMYGAANIYPFGFEDGLTDGDALKSDT